MLPSSTYSEPSRPPRNAIPHRDRIDRSGRSPWGGFTTMSLANQSEIKQITNLWRWVGGIVLTLPVWDVNDFFWGLRDTTFKWRTTSGRTYAEVESILSVQSVWTPWRWMWFTSLQLSQQQTTDLARNSVATSAAASEAAAARTSVILRTLITEKSFLLKMVCCSKPKRLVIPTSLRVEYPKDLQAGYLAGHKTLLKAKKTVFWSGISDYVRNAVKLCDACHKYKPAQQKEPLIPHDNTLAKGILNRKTSLKPRLKSQTASWRRQKTQVLILQYWSTARAQSDRINFFCLSIKICMPI